MIDIYCKKCGHQIEEGSDICLMCGQRQSAKLVNDNGNKLWGVLGLFFPIVGLILFIVWKDDDPKNSKYAGIGALISVITEVTIAIMYVICIIISFSIGILYSGIL